MGPHPAWHNHITALGGDKFLWEVFHRASTHNQCRRTSSPTPLKYNGQPFTNRVQLLYHQPRCSLKKILDRDDRELFSLDMKEGTINLEVGGLGCFQILGVLLSSTYPSPFPRVVDLKRVDILGLQRGGTCRFSLSLQNRHQPNVMFRGLHFESRPWSFGIQTSLTDLVGNLFDQCGHSLGKLFIRNPMFPQQLPQTLLRSCK